MNFNNHTPFPAISWENVQSDGRWYISSVVRVKYSLEKTEKEGFYKLALHKEQGDLRASDEFFKDNSELLKYESDYIPFKKNTDIVVLGNAQAPYKKESKAFLCSTIIKNDLEDFYKESILKIEGESFYKKEAMKYLKSKPKDVLKVPITYDKSFGGQVVIKNKDGEEEIIAYDKNNPYGCGLRHKKSQDKIIVRPQIIFYKQKENANYPAGFSALSNTFWQRLKYSGTYDDKWLEEIHPYPPKDFDYKFYQTSNPSLRLKNYLKKGTQIVLKNIMNSDFMIAENENIQGFSIPILEIYSKLNTNIKTLYRKLNIDTVYIDVLDDNLENCFVSVSYRDMVLQPKSFVSIESILV